MRKRLAILGLLALIGGAWSQVPRDGSKQHENAKEEQKPADPSKPVVVIESPAGANNQEQASEKPAKYPWGELLAPTNIPNWFLVVVGGITGWFVYKTLRAIKKQADIMETGANDARASAAAAALVTQETLAAIKRQADSMDAQATHMENQARSLGDSVAETRRSVNVSIEQMQMVKNKERARLEVEIEKFDFNPATKRLFIQKIRWRIRLHGQTEAFIVTGRMIGCIGEPHRETLQNHGRQMEIRSVIAPSDRIAQGECFISPLSGAGEDVGDFDLASLKERKGVLWCMGAIVFKDVFGDAWLLRFKRKWAYELFGSDQMEGDGWGGEWVREGEGEGENEEQPVKISPPKAPSNPN